MDESDSFSEIQTSSYEYYQFILSAKSIKKINLNNRNDGPKGQGIERIVIANAGDLAGTDFACLSSETDNTITQLKIEYVPAMQILDLETTDRKPIQFFDVKNIYFGDSRKDLNLCADKLYTIDAVPVLTGSTA